MADDVTLPGTGSIVESKDTFATSGVHEQRQVITIAPRDLSAADSIGTLTESAPASDTASSGLNGRLQRIAQRLTTLIGTALSAVLTASAASGGVASTYRLLASVGTSGDAAFAKASAGRIYSIQGYNAATGVRYLKIYNKASAPTVGTDTPVKTLALPPQAAFAFDFPVGYYLATGIGIGLTIDAADASVAFVAAGDIVGLNVDYA